MYCPKCNQQQTSEEMRYCSRCGFSLTGVAQLLANDGFPLEPLGKKAIVGSSRKKILSESAYLTLIAWVVALVATLFVDFGGPFELFAMLTAVLFFIIGLIGLIRFIYGFLFVKDLPTILKQETPKRSFSGSEARLGLPPQQSVPANAYPRATHTKEIVPQPSVTENTTRLLDEQITHRDD